MTVSTGNSPALIAGDLAVAIHQGSIRDGERLPSQAKLAQSYGVSSGTAAAALAKLAAVGLIQTAPGSGTYATASPDPFEPNPVLDVMAAASVCRTLAGLESGPGEPEPPALAVGGSPRWGTVSKDDETMPPRSLDVDVLPGLDRHVLRWMSEAYVSAARRLVAHGVSDTDRHLIESARAILRDGGRRPQDQPALTWAGSPQSADEDVVLRIWPERGEPRDPGGPPF
ncbi:GntR family transcriptional regulator [Streptomyces adustus]|uniref:GntR family transcriptional regulator n=1 Tax=Streptomyces adustus TaxID=1609272 RepID=A0A5N8VNA1_9ACTN|nr:GntR family transcriptional regulator [Streptomyces adustus]MPY36757.1 GntR family transcriptional regulator [Streptomyces adustus]